MHDAATIVITNAPDRAVARAIAMALLDARLAACVNIGSGVESLYHWQGRIETGDEVPVAIKTRSSLYSNVELAIRKIHPYDTPEILAIPVARIDRHYHDWLRAETCAEAGAGDADTAHP